MLHARDLVACRSIVLGDLGLNDNFGIEFVRYNKIRRLIETANPLRTL